MDLVYNDLGRVVSKQKNVVNLAMQMRFLQGASSHSSNVSPELVAKNYESFFGVGSFNPGNYTSMISNVLASYDDISFLLQGIDEKQKNPLSGFYSGFSKDELIAYQKAILNLGLELKFLQGYYSKIDHKKRVALIHSGEDLRKQYDGYFGEGTSKGRSMQNMVNDLLSYNEGLIYSVMDTNEDPNGLEK